MTRMHNPPHPGRVLKEALANIPMTVTAFAAHIGMARANLSKIINERAGISADLSIKLSDAFEQGQPDIWFRMQNAFDFWAASQSKRKPVKPVHKQAA